MAVNITSIKTSSNGIWQGDDPLHFAFPLLIIQSVFVLFLSRLLAFFLKPFRQPKVIAEIIGGILLGPSAFGRNKTYLRAIFPSWSTPILETVANFGLLFFLFLVGLELDLNSIRHTGKRVILIAAAGIFVPFTCGVGVAFLLRSTIPGADQAGYAPFLVFMGVSLSITAFPVLARILAELKLLTTRLGETAMAAAAFNDIVAWVLLALAVALSDNQKSPIVSLWVLLSGVAFVAIQVIIVRPAMNWVVHRAESEGGESEAWLALTLAGVLVSGFCTDFIGIHSIFGAFVFGLMVPKDSEFAGRLIERIEDFVAGLLLPLYFASSGLKTNVGTIRGGRAWGLLVMVISTACAGKILGTLLVAILCKMAIREAVALGFIMNTKGLVELIVLNIGKERKVLDDETFAILVLMALFTTFITTPAVMAVYPPARSARRQRKLQRSSATTPQTLRVLACVHSPRDVPSILTLIDSIRPLNTSPMPQLKLYVLHLIELTERSSSIVLVRLARRNGLPFRNPLRRRSVDAVDAAFEAYGQLGHVVVRTMTAVSAMATMHEDVCAIAENKRVSLVVLPFHKHCRRAEDGSMVMENVGHGWRLVNQRVLKEAPCSVAVLVDRGLGGVERVRPTDVVARRVCVIFCGGMDDREALDMAGRMVEHPGVRVTVMRFVDGRSNGDEEERRKVHLWPFPRTNSEKGYSFSTAPAIDKDQEREKDEEALAEFRKKTEGKAVYEERTVKNIAEAVLGIGKSREYELVVVGKCRFATSMVAELAWRPAEHPELGPIGDVLASSNHGVVSSVLVVQQYNGVRSEGTSVPVTVDAEAATVTDAGNASNKEG